MLGTDLKQLIARTGVTPEWYKAMKARVGLLPDCDCEMRTDLLNQTWEAWKKGGWKEAKIAYNNVKDYYAQPR